MIGLHQPGWNTASHSLASIVGLGPEKADAHGNATRELFLCEGKVTRLTARAIDQLLERPVQLLPAERGTELCHWDLDEQDPEIWYRAVIAWALCVDGEIRPVTPCGVNDGSSEPTQGNFVKLPDGRITAVGAYGDVCGFDDAAGLLKHLLDEKWAIDEQRRAAATLKEQGA